MMNAHTSRLVCTTCVLAACLVFGAKVMPVCASPFEQLSVGSSHGPVGRTNIQTLTDFEDGGLHTEQNPTAEGYYFSQNSRYQLSVVDGGPQGSQKALRIEQLTGAYEDYGEWKYLQLWWVGPRTGLNAYVKESRRANSMSFDVKGFDALVGSPRQNFVLGGYSKQKSPQYLLLNEPESHNMHNYFQTIIDWGGETGTWREILYRANPVTQRHEQHAGGYEPFLNHAELWPDHTRFYFQFDAGTPDVGPGDVFLDNIRFFYENPFMAAFPHVSQQRAQPGQTVTHKIVVWNTHPSLERNLYIRLAGWQHDVNENQEGQGADWFADNAVVTDPAGQPITQTGPLAPGQGFVFHVTFTVPDHDKLGQAQQDGNDGILLLSVYQDPHEVLNQHPHQQAPSIKNITENRYDLPGIGMVLTTVIDTNPSPAGVPPAVTGLQASQVGRSWADLEWTSPATTGNTHELSTDPAVNAYAIRYSLAPVTDEQTWQTAVPVESVPSVFGPGLSQRYALRGLSPSTQYYAAVRVYNEEGLGSDIQSIAFSTSNAPEDTLLVVPPVSPQELEVRPE